MATVTVRWIFALLAKAKIDFARFGYRKTKRGDGCTFVGAIAKRLVFGTPAGAPIVLSLVEINLDGVLCGYDRSGHIVVLGYAIFEARASLGSRRVGV